MSAAKRKTNKQQRQEVNDGDLILRKLSDVRPQKVKWLWPGVLAIGKLTILSGHPGLGKSLIALDIGARVTNGKPFPGTKTRTATAFVIALSAEDDPSDTIRPRFDLARGIPSRFVIIEGTRRKGTPSHFDLDQDIAALEKAVTKTPRCRLVIIDPLSAYLGKTDAHKNSEVRQLLRRLAELAARKRVAVLLVEHLNKNEFGSAVTRTQGSIAFVAASRIALLVSEDHSQRGRRLMVPIKNNLVTDRSGWGYEISDGPIIKWESKPVEVTAQDVLQAPPQKRRPRADALEWLRGTLSSGPMERGTIERQGELAGHSWATIRRAADALQVEKRKGRKTRNAPFMWFLPDSEPVEQVEQVHRQSRGRSKKGNPK